MARKKKENQKSLKVDPGDRRTKDINGHMMEGEWNAALLLFLLLCARLLFSYRFFRLSIPSLNCGQCCDVCAAWCRQQLQFVSLPADVLS
jgi:hypothetical protein